MHTKRKEAGMNILVKSMARLNFSSPRSFKLETWKIKARVRSNGKCEELKPGRASSPLYVHVCYVGPEGHRALKLAGVDEDEDHHGVYHHGHPEVLQDSPPPLKVHLDKTVWVC